MHATMEPIVSILRGGHIHKEFGDPYEYAVTVLFVEPHRVILKGLVMKDEKKFTLTHAKHIRDLLRSYGVSKVDYERKTNKSRDVKLDI